MMPGQKVQITAAVSRRITSIHLAPAALAVMASMQRAAWMRNKPASGKHASI